MARRLRAPKGTDEANYGQTAFKVQDDGTVDVPDEAVASLVGVGGFSEVPTEPAPVDMNPSDGATLKAPEGATSCSWGGQTFDVAEDGTVDVPHESVGDLIGHGFQVIEKIVAEVVQKIENLIDPAPAKAPAPPAPVAEPEPAPAPFSAAEEAPAAAEVTPAPAEAEAVPAAPVMQESEVSHGETT
jgi:hypothetical protein